MGWLYTLLGIGPKILPARPDGALPWSQTVVNINRQKRKRSKRTILLLVFMVSAGACMACSLYAWNVSSTKRAGTVSARYTPTPTRIPPTSLAPSPTPQTLPPPIPPTRPSGPSPTPQPQPLIEIQAWADLVEGAPGAIVHFTINATQNGHVTIWWDNRDALAKADTNDFNAALDVTVPADAAPGQHVVIVEVLSLDGYSVDRVISPFTVLGSLPLPPAQ